MVRSGVALSPQATIERRVRGRVFQGMSRSPAVAAAISKCLGFDERTFHRQYQPNRYVYRLVVEAWAQATSVATATVSRAVKS